jgi:Domain of unknown function (DUF4352)
VRRLVLTAGLAALVAGCGSSAETATNPQSAGEDPPVVVHPARVGGVVTLTGADRLRLAVKVKRVISHATGQGAFETPRKGERFVAVRFVLKNVGHTTYDDSPTFGAKVVDDDGHGYDPTVATVSAGAGFHRTVRLRRGQVASGFIVFAVPKRATIDQVQYTLAAGSGEDRGEWRVR